MLPPPSQYPWLPQYIKIKAAYTNRSCAGQRLAVYACIPDRRQTVGWNTALQVKDWAGARTAPPIAPSVARGGHILRPLHNAVEPLPCKYFLTAYRQKQYTHNLWLCGVDTTRGAVNKTTVMTVAVPVGQAPEQKTNPGVTSLAAGNSICRGMRSRWNRVAVASNAPGGPISVARIPVATINTNC